VKKVISEDHVKNALDGYLKALAIIDDDEIVVAIKRTRNNDYEVEVEKE
jgi:hypothetical protein